MSDWDDSDEEVGQVKAQAALQDYLTGSSRGRGRGSYSGPPRGGPGGGGPPRGGPRGTYVIEIVYEKPFSHPLDFQFLCLVKGVFSKLSGIFGILGP